MHQKQTYFLIKPKGANKMKKLIAVLICIMTIACFAACEEVTGIEDITSASGSADIDTTPSGDTTPVIDSSDYIQAGSDQLPETLVGSWIAKEVYQDARASDISPDSGLATESSSGIQIDYVSFNHNGTHIENPVYEVTVGADINALTAAGIQPDAFSSSDTVDIAAVKQSADGSPIETVYLVNGTTLLAFGSGGHVYTYEAVEAVG